MKLQALSTEDIKSFIDKIPGPHELPYRLFPSQYNQIDIMGYDDKLFFDYFESIQQDSRINLVCDIFNYCFHIKNNPDVLNIVTYKNIKSIHKILNELKEKLPTSAANNNESTNSLQVEIDKYEDLLKIKEKYNIVKANAWLFSTIVNFMKSHLDTFDTEKLLWSFCTEYFEEEDLRHLSSSIKKDTNIELEVDYTQKFPYKVDVPIKAHVAITIDNAEFTDCVEVSICHFFYMCQPLKIDSIMEYWDQTNSPLKEKVKDFFHFIQGPKRANNDNPSVRQIWATIVSRIPGLIYKKKSDLSLDYFDVELNAGWFNYLKAIAFLKNQKDVWDDLCKLQNDLSDYQKILPEMKTATCECFAKLAGEKLESIKWYDCRLFDGIKDMEDGTFDLLGAIECTFKDVPKPIGYVMMDGHGYVNWMNYL